MCGQLFVTAIFGHSRCFTGTFGTECPTMLENMTLKEKTNIRMGAFYRQPNTSLVDIESLLTVVMDVRGNKTRVLVPAKHFNNSYRSKFHKWNFTNLSVCVNLSALVPSIGPTRVSAVQFVEENNIDDDAHMKVLYNATSMLRQAIGKSKPWCFNGSLTHPSDEHLPKELYIFFRWLLLGSNTRLYNDAKSRMGQALTTRC